MINSGCHRTIFQKVYVFASSYKNMRKWKKNGSENKSLILAYIYVGDTIHTFSQ